MLRGTLAAAITPLRDGGAALDEEAFAPYVDFLVEGGVDGMLALGTTGEGILLSVDERKRAAELFVAAAGGRFHVAVHAGAQTTADTAEVARHAASAGADAVAVIGPPYYVLDEEALYRHFAAASEAVEPYLIEGLDIFVGAETLVERGLAAGAAGAVSGLAAAFPEGGPKRRAVLERYPFQAALKFVLGRRGLPVREDVRAPLRTLTAGEKEELGQWLESS